MADQDRVESPESQTPIRFSKGDRVRVAWGIQRIGTIDRYIPMHPGDGYWVDMDDLSHKKRKGDRCFFFMDASLERYEENV